MSGPPKLLIVDDEEVICRGCRRVFEPQGFQVETATEARRGLELAKRGEHAAILLDIKMPVMDGMEFLRELRKAQPQVPVIFITGYPSLQTAFTAMRLGAADYVTKPFSPEEITRAVQRLLRWPEAGKQATAPPVSAEGERWVPAGDEVLFWHESWFQQGANGAVRTGAVLPRSAREGVRGVRLPRLGEVAYQGLPLAGLTEGGVALRIIPAPLSGIVVEVNERLAPEPALLWTDTRADGWIATIAPTRLEVETERCVRRTVVLADANSGRAAAERRKLESLGCQVRTASDWTELCALLPGRSQELLLLDEASFGDRDAKIVERVKALAPFVKIVVMAAGGCEREAAYRKADIYYYAVEPFADEEIVDVLDSAFRPPVCTSSGPARGLAGWQVLSGISIINHERQRICLLASGELLRQDRGIGWHLERKLRQRHYPIELTAGARSLSPGDVIKEADACDRLLVLMSRDAGALAGSLVRDAKGTFLSLAGVPEGKGVALVVQPAAAGAGPLDFDARTCEALAEHILSEMEAGPGVSFVPPVMSEKDTAGHAAHPRPR